MIIDIRNHFKKIQQPAKYFSRKEIEERVDRVLSYMKMEIAARKIAVGKVK